MLSHQGEDREEGMDGDVLDTPGGAKNKWTDAPEPDTPGSRSKRPAKGGGGAPNGKGVTLTLRDQEKVRNVWQTPPRFFFS